MARQRKCRKVCYFPQIQTFSPAGGRGGNETITLSVDEYETIRLIDQQGLSQEQCGRHMGIARTTVQLVYSAARKKLADFLVKGCGLRIEGGEFCLCNGQTALHGCQTCFKHHINRQYTRSKDENTLRIAIAADGQRLCRCDDYTASFQLCDARFGKLCFHESIQVELSGHDATPANLLLALDVDILLCNGIAQETLQTLSTTGIRLCCTASGNVREAVEELLEEKAPS